MKKIEKYFVCHRFRSYTDDSYAKKFYDEKKYTKLHDSYKEANKELRESFYDDSDYSVYKVTNGSHFERIKS